MFAREAIDRHVIEIQKQINDDFKNFISSVNVDNDGDKEKEKKAEKNKHEQPTYIPPPAELEGFPGAKKLPNKKGKRPAWTLPDGGIGEWDSQHGEVEVYDKTGKKHKGAYDPDTGEKKKDGEKGRTATRAKFELKNTNASTTIPSPSMRVSPPKANPQTVSAGAILLIVVIVLLAPLGI